MPERLGTLAPMRFATGLLFFACAAHAEVVVIGNSLTSHLPKAGIGWPLSNGMAATSTKTDFAHLVATTINQPLTIISAVPLEQNRPFDMPASITAEFVIVQLGDNARDIEFIERYRTLLAAIHAKRLICVSTWWQNLSLDAAIYDACTARSGEYVYIGDILMDRRNTDRPTYSNKGVDRHPHDWGMARIAERVEKATR